MSKGLNLRAVAERLGCSIDQVRNLVHVGELRAVNIGLGAQRARWVVSESELDSFVARRENRRPTQNVRRAGRSLARRDWV